MNSPFLCLDLRASFIIFTVFYSSSSLFDSFCGYQGVFLLVFFACFCFAFYFSLVSVADGFLSYIQLVLYFPLKLPTVTNVSISFPNTMSLPNQRQMWKLNINLVSMSYS